MFQTTFSEKNKDENRPLDTPKRMIERRREREKKKIEGEREIKKIEGEI